MKHRRYIDANALIKEIKENAEVVTDNWNWYGISVSKAITLLEDAPTADVVERKKGKWRLNRVGNWACPFCEFDPYHDEMNGMNYCPNCGAKLEGFDNGKVH